MAGRSAGGLAPLRSVRRRQLILFFAAFILHFGNRQFGGYDCSVLIDTGWRLATGQKPYVDFVCTVPPGFYLGAKYAFEWFGASWDAQLWVTSIYASITFLWMYWLFGVLLESRVAAFLMAFVIECAAMLLFAFWWYNNVTDVAAAVFFLSCLVYLKRPSARSAQATYVISLAMLALMKPNIAGLLGLGSIVLLLAATPFRRRFAALSFAGIAVAALFLEANGASVRGMLASYATAAIARGKAESFRLS